MPDKPKNHMLFFWNVSLVLCQDLSDSESAILNR